MNPQSLHLTRGVEAVAAFCLDRGRAVRGKLLKRRKRALLERFLRGRSQLLDAGENSAAVARDFFVARSSNTHLILFGAARGEHQMGVRVHETGKRDAPAGIELFRGERLDRKSTRLN